MLLPVLLVGEAPDSAMQAGSTADFLHQVSSQFLSAAHRGEFRGGCYARECKLVHQKTAGVASSR
jgi:hypothetical protein